MLTKHKRIKLQPVTKNPLAEKLKAKHARIIKNLKSYQVNKT